MAHLKWDLAHKYEEKLSIYYYKENSGPGDSRNYGMKKSKRRLLYHIRFSYVFRQLLTEVDKVMKKLVLGLSWGLFRS
jgi:hypothetical protein